MHQYCIYLGQDPSAAEFNVGATQVASTKSADLLLRLKIVTQK